MKQFREGYPSKLALQVYIVARELGYYVEKIFMAGGLILTVHCEDEETFRAIEALASERKQQRELE